MPTRGPACRSTRRRSQAWTSSHPFPRTADRTRFVAGIVVLTVVVDQVSKWWAWRHVDGSGVNAGGHFLLGGRVRGWFAEPVAGAVADALGVVAVVAALAVLVARAHRATTLVGGALVAAGWATNLLDRLGLHRWTAPGSGRGVVDFVPTGLGYRGNLADVLIGVGAVLLAAGLIGPRLSGASRAAG